MKYIVALIALVLLALMPSAQAGWPIRGGAASAAPPPTGAYHSFGDSITVGTGQGVVSYPYTISTDKSLTLSNFAQNGLNSSQMNTAEVFGNEYPGDSGNPIYTIMIGTNDVGGTPESVYINNLESAVSWLGVPISSKVPATSCSAVGSWGLDGGGGQLPPNTLGTGSPGDTLACTITINNGVFYAWYASNGFTYTVDGGAPVTGIANSRSTISVLRLTGLSNGSHTVQFTNTTGTGPCCTSSFAGVGTAPLSGSCCIILGAGVLRQQNDTNSSGTASYNADANTAYVAMASDGLNVTFVDVRAFVNDTTDMGDQFHPNQTGQGQLVLAFESVWP